jgi:hypothetical protein
MPDPHTFFRYPSRQIDCQLSHVANRRYSTACTMHYTACTMHYTACPMHYTACTMRYTHALCTILMHYALYSCTMHYTHTLSCRYSTACTMHYTQALSCRYSTACTMHYTHALSCRNLTVLWTEPPLVAQGNTLRIHCAHPLYSYTVLIHCTHTLYASSHFTHRDVNRQVQVHAACVRAGAGGF